MALSYKNVLKKRKLRKDLETQGSADANLQNKSAGVTPWPAELVQQFVSKDRLTGALEMTMLRYAHCDNRNHSEPIV